MKLILNEQLAFKNPNWNVDFQIWDQMKTILHSHTFYEIFIVTKGVLYHTINGNREILSVGDARLIRPSDSHVQFCHGGNPAGTLNFSFNADFLSHCGFGDENLAQRLSAAETADLYHLSGSELKYINYLAENITTATLQTDEIRRIKTLILLLTDYFISAQKIIQNEAAPECFSRFIRLLNDPRNFSLSIGELCKKVNYTPAAMSAIFKKYSGRTIIKYITDIKINYACNILRNTNYSVTTITSILGYDSISHFDHIFKSRIGITPKQYKAKNSSKGV